MSSKKYAFILVLILCTQAVFLGISFSKESGTSKQISLNETKKEDVRIIFSKENKLSFSDEIDISLINESNEEKEYSLVIKEIKGNSLEGLKVNVDYNEVTIENGIIKTDKLSPSGKENDQKSHNITIDSNNNNNSYMIEIVFTNPTALSTQIKTDTQVYKDEYGNYRYYGSTVNNYINYENETYQIIGLIDGKIKLLSSNKGLGIYDITKGDYPTLQDYLYSFNNKEVNISNVLNYSSWMTIDQGYWLNDTNESNNAYYASKINGIGTSTKYVSYYLRYTKIIDKELNVVKGNGSINNPYEVLYES